MATIFAPFFNTDNITAGPGLNLSGASSIESVVLGNQTYLTTGASTSNAVTSLALDGLGSATFLSDAFDKGTLELSGVSSSTIASVGGKYVPHCRWRCG